MSPVVFADIAQYARAELCADVPSVLPQLAITGVTTSSALKPGSLAFAKRIDTDSNVFAWMKDK